MRTMVFSNTTCISLYIDEVLGNILPCNINIEYALMCYLEIVEIYRYSIYSYNIVFVFCVAFQSNSDECRLRSMLLSSYVPEARPVINTTTVTVVDVGLTIIQVMDLVRYLFRVNNSCFVFLK